MTPYYDEEDWLRTSHAVRNKLQPVLRYGRLVGVPEIRRNAERLGVVLAPIEDKFGATIWSWYRCPELNRLVGGAANSVHTVGAAADIDPEKGTHGELLRWLTARSTPVPFEKAILEQRGSSTWLHLEAPQDTDLLPDFAVWSSPRAGLYVPMTRDQILAVP